jgi:hypothetical protein
VARSTRNDPQRPSAPRIEQGFRVPAEPAAREEGSLVELGPAPETLNLGHAGLRNECWPGTNAMVSSTSRGGPAAPRRAMLRPPRPPRKRPPLHGSGPSQRAEARFIPDSREILTD